MLNKKKYISKGECAPCSKGKKPTKTCYSLSALNKIIKAWNSQYPDKKIEVPKSKEKDIDFLWKGIQYRLSSSCGNNEKCWKEQDFIKKLKDIEIQFYTFKPEYPKEWLKNKYSWLSTYDILYVMKQYEKLYDKFMFLGPVPADCPTKINCELSNLNINKLIKSGIDYVGIVYNLDTSNQSGSHWVAMFIDIPNAEVNYYDSTGTVPTPLIKEFIIKMAKKIKGVKNNVSVIVNDKQHQHGYSECGVYSMNFILERLDGKTMYDISQMKIPDAEMNHLRNLLYSK